MQDYDYIHVGCGRHAPAEWANFDASIFALLPVMRRGYPRNVKFGNAKRLPVPDGVAQYVYASHVYEHLSRQEANEAFREAFRVLKPGGRLRMIVPDLRFRAARYLKKVAEGVDDANDEFMRSTELGVERSGGLYERVREVIGHSRHQWMWDEPSICRALQQVGFREVRRCKFGDAPDPKLRLVEREDRFVTPKQKNAEVAVEAVK